MIKTRDIRGDNKITLDMYNETVFLTKKNASTYWQECVTLKKDRLRVARISQTNNKRHQKFLLHSRWTIQIHQIMVRVLCITLVLVYFTCDLHFSWSGTASYEFGTGVCFFHCFQNKQIIPTSKENN